MAGFKSPTKRKSDDVRAFEYLSKNGHRRNAITYGSGVVRKRSIFDDEPTPLNFNDELIKWQIQQNKTAKFQNSANARIERHMRESQTITPEFVADANHDNFEIVDIAVQLAIDEFGLSQPEYRRYNRDDIMASCSTSNSGCQKSIEPLPNFEPETPDDKIDQRDDPNEEDFMDMAVATAIQHKGLTKQTPFLTKELNE